MRRAVEVGSSLVALAVLASVAAGTSGATAAPTAPGVGPIKDPIAGRPLPAVKPKLDFSLLTSEPQACGKNAQVTVRIKNLDTVATDAKVSLSNGVKGAAPGIASVKLQPAEQKDVDIKAPWAIDCTKALPSLGLKLEQIVAPRTPALLIFEKSLRPTIIGLKAQPAGMPPSTNTHVWLRRIELTGLCGNKGKVVADLMRTAGTGTEDAKINLSVGSTASELTASVPVNQATQVSLEVPQLDCSAGVPAVQYNLSTGNALSGTAKAQFITYEPNAI